MLRITSPKSVNPSCWMFSEPMVITGDGEVPPRMRVPVTVIASRSRVSGATACVPLDGCSGFRMTGGGDGALRMATVVRSEEHTSELQSLMRISYAVFCLKKKINKQSHKNHTRMNIQKTEVNL